MRKNADTKVEKSNREHENAIHSPVDWDLKLRWYQLPATWVVTRHDRPAENLTETDPPECGCLLHLPPQLLHHGGDRVVLYRKETALENLSYILQGTVMEGKTVRMRRGERSRCHSNVSRLWLGNPKKYRIVQGSR